MKYTILKQFGSGQITIPKKWRGDAKEAFWRARQKGREIILEPIEEADKYGTEFWEDENGFGLNFKKGIPAGELLKRFKKADSILKEQKSAKIS